ncbi:hypothetical protein CTEN210_17865 [Chaetoceros tenuissimus]|uniref:EF-hand domain-containing protein n=1 Tax=Chaetoceros tenuissimus TaxID=426638 RepID=A0AAD3DBG7_9STRA|nr:hypothetical protein CTEN210_17865 [Chaetoceros tenuissimus]
MYLKQTTLITVLYLAVNTHAFSIRPTAYSISTPSRYAPSPIISSHKSPNYKTALFMAEDADDEIERLKSMAAKLRADAAKLEAEKAQQLADAAEKAFNKFDTNQDGEISLQELKAGLEKELKIDLSEKRVQELMKEFDASGDGALQLDEFVTIDQFRNKLEALSREEKRLAAEAKKMAQREAEIAAMAQAKIAILNDGKPTMSDKFLSILPYLFPLLDGVQYGRYILADDGAASNPFVIILAVLYSLYKVIPFSGFAAFLALQFLGGNPSINRLIRYNMQQAILLDIALFFPGLISLLFGGLLNSANVQLPGILSVISSDAIFVSLLAVLGYCTVSSLLGQEPNKVPLISKAVDDRMPTVDMLDFDSEGNIFARRKDDEVDDKKKDEK